MDSAILSGSQCRRTVVILPSELLIQTNGATQTIDALLFDGILLR